MFICSSLLPDVTLIEGIQSDSEDHQTGVKRASKLSLRTLPHVKGRLEWEIKHRPVNLLVAPVHLHGLLHLNKGSFLSDSLP